MKLIATEGGQVLQLIVMDEIRPLSGLHLPNLLRAVGERYEFVTRPKNFETEIENGAKFRVGHIEIKGQDIAVNELGIYNDGIIVLTADTKQADAVLDNLLAWTTEAFQLRERETVKQRTYTSSLVVEFDVPVETAFRHFEAISTEMTSALKAIYGWDHQINLLRAGFSADALSIPQYRNTQFSIERRAQIPFEKNRYFCIAPLPTEQHLQLLKTIERHMAEV